MSEIQFYVSVAVVPTVTIIIVLIGVLLNNTNMNARLSDLRSAFDARLGDFDARLEDLRDTLRAEMAKNHSEMLHRFAELDMRLSRIEARSK